MKDIRTKMKLSSIFAVIVVGLYAMNTMGPSPSDYNIPEDCIRWEVTPSMCMKIGEVQEQVNRQLAITKGAVFGASFIIGGLSALFLIQYRVFFPIDSLQQ